MTFTHALSTNNYGPAKFIVDSNAANGTHTTIASAISSASSGDIIAIRPGTYTENFTLPANVDLMGMGGAGNDPLVTIVGKITASDAGSRTISNVRLQTNSDVFLAVTGSAATIVYIDNCYLNITNANGINSTTSSVDSQIWIKNSLGNCANTFHIFDIDHGFIEFLSTIILSNSTSANTVDNDSGAFFKYTYFSTPITSSGTSSFTGSNSTFDNAQNATLTVGGSGNNRFENCKIDGGSSTAVSVSVGCIVKLYSCSVLSSNAATVAGAGTIQYSGLSMGAVGAITTTTQTSHISHHGQYRATGQPAFLALNSATDTDQTGDGTAYTIINNTEIFDQNSNYNNGTGTFTAPLTGVYLHTVSCYLLNMGAAFTNLKLSIVTSNRTYFIQYNPTTMSIAGDMTTALSEITDMDAADTATIVITVAGSTKTVDIRGAANDPTTSWGCQLIA